MSAKERMVGGEHYKAGVEPWDVIDTWSLEQQIGFFRGNILKYTMRMGRKAGQAPILEARKIEHYAQKLVEVLSENRGLQGDQG
jgi:hypothetical protein